ncbi:MAG TPA: hypothetical protein PKA06_13755, partial [Gemmatales bacterium]|nr:hypothetical protein [Gemmatales bacterium]
MHVFGPVLQYDLVTTARKSRYFAMRFFYAALLFLVLYIFYAVKLEGSDVGRVARQKLIDFAEFFSYTYLIIQYILVLLLTPAYVGTAIAEEKERRTLEFLMATDLKSHEIILGKTASRLGNLLMFLLAGLPVLMFVLFFGGIDPELLKNGFIATLLTAISITCVSIYCSTHAPRSRDGILRSYLVVVGYFIMCIILGWLVIFLQGQFWTVGISWKLENADLITQGLCYFTEYFLTGNIFHAIYLYISTTYTPFLGFTSWTGVNLGTSIDQILRNYSIFHLILAVLCLTISIRRLRRLFALHTFGEKASKPFTRFKHQPDSNVNKNIRDKGKKTELSVRRRYRIDSWPPMVWKEVLLPRWNMSGVWLRVVKLFAWAGFLLPLGMLFLFNFQHGRFDWYELQQTTNVYARIAGTICL